MRTTASVVAFKPSETSDEKKEYGEGGIYQVLCNKENLIGERMVFFDDVLELLKIETAMPEINKYWYNAKKLTENNDIFW